MSPKRKQDEVEDNKEKKRVTGRNPVFLQRTRSINDTKATGNVKKNKALPKVKHFFIAQMENIEKDMVNEYLEKEK